MSLLRWITCYWIDCFHSWNLWEEGPMTCLHCGREYKGYWGEGGYSVGDIEL